MGWNNQAVSLIILTEENSGFSGLFGYSPAPGGGDLVTSIAVGAGTDPYGNGYVAGLASYDPATGQLGQLDSGGLLLGSTALTALGYLEAQYENAGLLGAAPVAELRAIDSASTEETRLEIAGPGGTQPAGVLLYGWEPSASDVLPVTAGISGALRYLTGGTSPALETWHDISADVASGWTVSTARYQRLAVGSTGIVICQIVDLAPPSSKPADGTLLWPAGTLPAGWAPAVYPPREAAYQSGGGGSETPALQARPDGGIAVYGVGGTTITRMDVTLWWPLD
jgi:hypothetical protein